MVKPRKIAHGFIVGDCGCALVTENGIAVPPCGRCREFIHQIHKDNLDTEVIIGEGKVIKLKDLLPQSWDE